MIHGYHVILPMYGVWLPNDPRGAWSDTIWKWELLRCGRPKRSLDRVPRRELTNYEVAMQQAAQKALRFPAVALNGLQAKSIADGFAETAHHNRYTIWACTIMPQHVHLVLARHGYAVEQMTNLLKGGATRRIIRDRRHPLAAFATDSDYPRMWAEKRWKVFLDSESQIETAIRYVEENPIHESKRPQKWRFVTPFRGLEPGVVSYH